MNTAREIAIVIPVRNDAARLRQCLAAIAASARQSQVAVVVADNGSTDDSAATAAAAGALVLPLPGRRVGELRNIAASASAAPLIGFVDADHVVDPEWMDAALAIFSDDTVTAAGAPYSSPPNANWVQRAYHRFRPVVTRRQPTAWLGSGNLIVRREAFERVRGFDETLEACEDVDLCNRLRAAGGRLVVDPGLRSIHFGDPASLRALFLGELWRGRDNIRVTLRGPLTGRSLPSVMIPVVDLAALVVMAAAPWTGRGAAVAAGLTFSAFAALRAVRMTLGGRPVSVRDLAANLAVAATYDLARALSLVARATHRTRRETAGERAVA